MVSTETNSGPASLQNRSIRRITAFMSKLAENNGQRLTVQIDVTGLTDNDSPIPLNSRRLSNECKSRDTTQENHHGKQPILCIPKTVRYHCPETNTSRTDPQPLRKYCIPDTLESRRHIEPSSHSRTEDNCRCSTRQAKDRGGEKCLRIRGNKQDHRSEFPDSVIPGEEEVAYIEEHEGPSIWLGRFGGCANGSCLGLDFFHASAADRLQIGGGENRGRFVFRFLCDHSFILTLSILAQFPKTLFYNLL